MSRLLVQGSGGESEETAHHLDCLYITIMETFSSILFRNLDLSQHRKGHMMVMMEMSGTWPRQTYRIWQNSARLQTDQLQYWQGNAKLLIDPNTKRKHYWIWVKSGYALESKRGCWLGIFLEVCKCLCTWVELLAGSGILDVRRKNHRFVFVRLRGGCWMMLMCGTCPLPLEQCVQPPAPQFANLCLRVCRAWNWTSRWFWIIQLLAGNTTIVGLVLYFEEGPCSLCLLNVAVVVLLVLWDFVDFESVPWTVAHVPLGS